MSIISSALGSLLSVIYGVIGNYGFSIIVFTLIVKTVLIPLSISQIRSTKKMSAIQPEIAALQKKYANDKDTLNIKTMELYQKNNINPLGGCLPLLVQMPILFGLFGVLREPATYVFGGDLELTSQVLNQGFLWISDLSQPDLISNVLTSGPAFLLTLPGILPIISAISTYFQMSTQNAGAAQANSSMKVMSTVFPAMILLWGRSFSAGLMIYWTVSNFFQLAQQAIVPMLVKEES